MPHRDLRPCSVAIAGLLAAAAGCAAPLPPPADARPSAASPDGRYRLVIEETMFRPSFGRAAMRTLFFWARLEPDDPEVLIADEVPERRVVLSDGRMQLQDVESKGLHNPWWTRAAEKGFQGYLDVGDEPARLSSLSFDLPLLRVRRWQTFTATVAAGDREVVLDAPPFRIRIEPGPQVCRVITTGEEPGRLDCSWAEETTEIVDSRGMRLVPIRGWGDGEAFTGHVAPPNTGRPEDRPIAFPLRVRLRVPMEYDVERIPFEFRDVLLPPPVQPAEEDVPARTSLRSAWSEHRDGVALRLSLPDRVLRGDTVEAVMGASLDPAAGPRGGFTIEELDPAHRTRLVLRNPASEATLELPPWSPPDGGSVEGAPPGPDPGEFPVRFLLSAIWDELVPGTWEARATLVIPPNPDSPAAWSGTLSTAPIPLVVEEMPPSDQRRARVIVPTALRLRTGKEPGTVDIGFGPADAEVIDVTPRNGFDLWIEWGSEEGRSGSSGRYPEVPETIDTLDPDDAMPLDRAYEVLLYEAPAWEYLSGGFGRGIRPILWKRSFRVTATAAEIEALRR